MNDPEHQLMEEDLRKLRPAQAPNVLIERLAALRPAVKSSGGAPVIGRADGNSIGRFLFRWIVPAATATVLVLIAVRSPKEAEHQPQAVADVPVRGGDVLKADEVEIDRQLLTTFDAVAELPTGEPVRFRCREWAETVMFRDSGRGIAVEQTRPRFEVVPVAFETY